MKKPILYNIILVILISVGFIFLLFPMYGKMSDLREKLDKRNEELENKEKYFSKLRQLKEQIENFKDEIVKITSSLPYEPDVLDVIDFMSSLSSKNGLIVQTISVSRTSRKSETKWVAGKNHLNFILLGSYESLKNFLSELYENSRLIEVEELSFNSFLQQAQPNNKGVNNMLEFNITISFPSY